MKIPLKLAVVYHFTKKKKKKKENWKVWITCLWSEWQERLHCTFKKFETAPNFVLVLQKMHRVIKFNQEAWLKPCIARNTELSENATNDFRKDLIKLMINSVLGKTMENVQRHRNIELITNEKRKDYLCWNWNIISGVTLLLITRPVGQMN